ncbi:MAG: 4-(cytidine 5'-diphospho)-2-C-methyl-D-erythritol kinase [Flavobacteriales bacterium]
MVVFPPAKINLGLNVLRKRADGFHEIESVLFPVPLTDVLEAIVDPELPEGQLIYSRSGTPIPGNLAADLCTRAHSMVAERRVLPGVRLHLHKVIPMGAGLGGGSSDGANTLSLLNDLLDLGLSMSELAGMAVRLGSDCSFFLDQGAKLATGRGEELTPVDLDLSGLYLYMIAPNVHVGTAEVYANSAPTERSAELHVLASRSRIPEWPTHLVNTMEQYVFRTYPAVADAKRLLIEAVHATLR